MILGIRILKDFDKKGESTPSFNCFEQKMIQFTTNISLKKGLGSVKGFQGSQYRARANRKTLK